MKIETSLLNVLSAESLLEISTQGKSPEQILIYKTQLALTKVVTLLDATLTRGLCQKK